MALLVGLLWACPRAQAAEVSWAWSGQLKLGAPVSDGEGHATRLSVEPSVLLRLPALEFKARVRLRSTESSLQRRSEWDLRELTATLRRPDATLILGAQQLNWGRMDILRLTDVLNSVDQLDLFVDELTQAKRALWMANLEWQLGKDAVQLIASPSIPADRFPSQWGGLPVQVSIPRRALRNTSLALRYNCECLGWNTDIVAVNGWHTSPQLFASTSAKGPRLTAALARQQLLGFAADKAVGTAVVRVEGSLARRQSADNTRSQSLGWHRVVAMGTGIDLRAGPWFAAVQAVAQHDREAEPGSGDNAYVSLILQRKWMQDRWSSRILGIRDVRSGSSWSSLQTGFEWSPNVVLQLQADWFNGPPSRAFGAYKDRSRVTASMRLEF